MSNRFGNGRQTLAQKGESFRLQKKLRRLTLQVTRLKHLLEFEREKNAIFTQMLRATPRGQNQEPLLTQNTAKTRNRRKKK